MAENGGAGDNGSVGMKRKLDDTTTTTTDNDDENARKQIKTTNDDDLGETSLAGGESAMMAGGGTATDPEKMEAAAASPELLTLDGAVSTDGSPPTTAVVVAVQPDEPAAAPAAEAAGNDESQTMDGAEFMIDTQGSIAKQVEDGTTTVKTVVVEETADLAAPAIDGPSSETTTTTGDDPGTGEAPNAAGVVSGSGDDDNSAMTSSMVIPKKQPHTVVAAAAKDGETEPLVPSPQSPADATTAAPSSSSSSSAAAPRPAVSSTSATTTTTTTSKPPNNSNAPRPTTTTMKSSNINPADEFVEEVDELLPEYVGRVIGKGGEMIRDLQARSGCKIDVDQNVATGAPRIISYKGPRAKVAFAKQLVHLLSVQNVPEDNLPLGEAVEEILAVPATVVGKVIGRGGEMIRELQSKSHAKIQVDHSNRAGTAPDQKRVSITGNKDSVAKAREMIRFLTSNPLMEAQQALNMLIQEKTRTGAPWGSGPPYVNLPNGGFNMQPYGTPAAPLLGLSGPSFGGGNAYGGGGGGNAMYPAGGGANPHGMYPPQQQQPFYSPAQEVVYVQKQYMGRLIGAKGVTINDLQRRSNCSIQINQNVPPGQDCEVTISGNPQGMESAKQMIQEIIQAGPSHPYAGGAPPSQQQQQSSYGGGAYGGSGGYGGGGYGGGMLQQAAAVPQAYVPPQQQAMYGGYDHRTQQTPSQQQQMTQGYNGAAVYGATAYQGYGQQQQQQQPGYGYAAAPVAAAAAPPSVWNTAKAPDGQVYYYNSQTGQTQWDKPPGMP